MNNRPQIVYFDGNLQDKPIAFIDFYFFEIHLLEQGTNLRVIYDLLGHENIQTTEIYTHVSKRYIEKIQNLLDELFNDST